jgi:TfoX/Sxy family transcriptional regulator of competence genes
VASSEELAERVRQALSDRDDISERKMFGGTGFMLSGNLCVGAQRNGNLLVRIDPEASDELTKDPHANLMVQRGREMAGWLIVDAAAIEDDAAFRGWLARGVAFASSLPPK